MAKCVALKENFHIKEIPLRVHERKIPFEVFALCLKILRIHKKKSSYL